MFIVYKTYTPITDSIYDLARKDAKNKLSENLKELYMNNTAIESAVLEGENSYLVIGSVKSLCEEPEPDEYCPVFIQKIQVNNNDFYASDNVITEVYNFSNKKEIDFFIPIKKEVENLLLEAVINLRTPTKIENHFSLITKYNEDLKKNILKKSKLEVNVSLFQVNINNEVLAINLEGATSDLDEETEILIMVVNKYPMINKIVHEENIEINKGYFKKTLSTEKTFEKISVILMIKTNESYYLFEKIIDKDSIKSLKYQ